MILIFSSAEENLSTCITAQLTLLHGLRNSLEDIVIGMAEDGRSPGSDVVNVLVFIDVPSVGALDAVEDDWVAADGLEGTDGRGDSTGHELQRRWGVGEIHTDFCENGMLWEGGISANENNQSNVTSPNRHLSFQTWRHMLEPHVAT